MLSLRPITIVLLLITSGLVSLAQPTHTWAQSPISTGAADVATVSAVATESALISTPSATVTQRIQDIQNQDITETSGTQKDKLAAFLDDNPPQPLSWNNFMEHAIRNAVKKGVPANIVVLVLLFPLTASIIAASRHIIGLRGFGIYIPAVLSVALVSTGVVAGTLIFVAIVSVALFSKRILKTLDLSYLPRTALLLWMISLAILAVFLVAPLVNLEHVMTINIFPILILVLLSENFLDAQASTKPADALALAVETLGLAFVSGLILRLELMQRLALLEPELLITFTAIFNILIGKFVGLRLTEWLRFRPIIEE